MVCLHDEFIKIDVGNPRTNQPLNASQFTDFEITLETNHRSFTRKHSCVRRRYSDFVWLRKRLASQEVSGFSRQPPDLPGKKIFGRFDPNFLMERQEGLLQFLQSIFEVNLYLADVGLHLFLQSELPVHKISKILEGSSEEENIVELLSSDCPLAMSQNSCPVSCSRLSETMSVSSESSISSDCTCISSLGGSFHSTTSLDSCSSR